MLSSEDQKTLFSSSRIETFSYRLLDKNEKEQGWLNTVKSCSVDYKSLSKLKHSAKIVMKDSKSIDFFNDRIQPFAHINALGKKLSYPLGIFLLNSPGRTTNGKEILRNIEAYSKLQILEDDKFVDRFYIPQNANVTNEIAKIILSTGETKVNITSSTKVTATSKEFEIGMTKLDAINKLLGEINYFSLRVDHNGFFVAEPYVLPIDREIDFNYIDDKFSVLYPDMKEDIDMFDVPNVFVCYTTSPERSCLRSVYRNDSPSSPSSTVSRGREIIKIYEIEDIADQEALDAYTRRLAFQYSQIYSHLQISTALMPFHGFADTLYLRNNQFGIEGKYEEIGWSIECKAGAKMKHRTRRVINI